MGFLTSENLDVEIQKLENLKLSNSATLGFRFSNFGKESERRGTDNHEDPSRFFRQILDMGSISSRNNEMESGDKTKKLRNEKTKKRRNEVLNK